MTHPVSLNIYDLSGFDQSGMLHNIIRQFLPTFEGIWYQKTNNYL